MQVKDVPARPNSHCLSDSTRMTMSLEGFHTGGDLNIEICGTTSSRLNEHINTGSSPPSTGTMAGSASFRSGLQT
jgi:hypothetical protein